MKLVTSTRRGFGKERHTGLKATLAGLAVGGFAVAWAGFGAAQPPVIAGSPLVDETAPGTTAVPTPTITNSPVTAPATPTPARTPASLPTPAQSPPTEAPPTVSGAKPDPTPKVTRTAKRTRGS